jgi:glycosyltransferase involved in cell wall biosynthesis
MISRLIEVKFAEDGIRAMIIAARHDPGTVGIVAGDGPLRGPMEALVDAQGLSDRIIFIGNVDQETLSLVIPLAVAISPLTGMALVEVGLGGSPAVAYDADWQSEFIEDGVNGYLVPTGDYELLGSRAASLLADAALKSRMSRAMRERALSLADRGKAAVIEKGVFEQLLATTSK